MKLNTGILTAVILVPASATPIPFTHHHHNTDNSHTNRVDLQPRSFSSVGTALANFGTAAAATTLVIGTGIGLSEWALNWYSRLLRDRQAREQKNQTATDTRDHHQEQCARRERAMDLMLEMAENYSDQVASSEGFDGNFEPLVVPNSIIGAIENVFEQTSEVEGLDGIGSMRSLNELKGALKPVMDFEKKDENAQGKRHGRMLGYTSDEEMPPVPSIPSVPRGALTGSPTANHRFAKPP
jgi:hypothetical protein